MAVLVWGAPGLIGLGWLSDSPPTPRPSPPLTVGETYWIGALTPRSDVHGPSIPNVAIYSKPGRVTDPGITIVEVFVEARPVKLAEIRDEWCYVEVNNIHGQRVEGWMDCGQLHGGMPDK